MGNLEPQPNIDKIQKGSFKKLYDYSTNDTKVDDPTWNTKISLIIERDNEHNKLIIGFKNFIENIKDSEMNNNTINTVSDISMSDQLAKHIILSKYKNTPEYIIIKNLINNKDSEHLIFWGIYLYFDIQDANDFENLINKTEKYGYIKELYDYSRLFIAIYLEQKKHNQNNCDINYTEQDMLNASKLPDEVYSVYLYKNGFIDNNIYDFKETANFFGIELSIAKRTYQKAMSLIATFNYYKPNKAFYDSSIYHEGELRIRDRKTLKIIILADAFMLKKATNEYNEILNDIINTNLIDNIITLHKQHSLGFFRALLLLPYQEYQIIKHYEHLNNILEFNTIIDTSLHFQISEDQIEFVLKRFYDDFEFFKYHYNDLAFVEIPLNKK